MAKPEPLTVDQLRAEVADGRIDTVAVSDHRHAGPAPGQADPRAVLRRRGPRARDRGLQLPARRRRRHEHRRRLRDVLVGQRLRRHGHDAGPQHPAPDAVAGRRRRRPVRRAVGRRQRRRRLAAAGPAQAARPPVRGRHGRLRRHRARVHRLPGHLRGGLAGRLPRPHAGEPLQRRLLHARRRPRRAAAAPHPQRDVRGRPGGRERQGRVQPRPARDRLPLHRCAHHLRPACRLQDRREGDRLPGGHVADLHGEVQRARGQLLPHPPVLPRHRRQRW